MCIYCLHCSMQFVVTPDDQSSAKAVSFLANSWVAKDVERIFFTGQPFLSIETPRGLLKPRETELASLRVRALAF